MDYEQFIIALKEKIALLLSPGMELQIHTNLKNNGKKRTGLAISDKNVNISPTIYLEEFFEQYKKGLSLDSIVESIWDVYHEVRFDHSWNLEDIKNLSEIQSKLSHKLISAERNDELLKSLPHTRFLDLAVVYYILFDVDDHGSATIPVTYDFLNFWGINISQLHKFAIENAPLLLPAQFLPMRVVVAELMGCECDEDILEDDFLFVLTNPMRHFGASCLLYPGILEQIACQLGENFYLLPSSIHETMIVPESQSPSLETLQEMVKEINETQMDVEEVLSDNVYYYNFQTKALT